MSRATLERTTFETSRTLEYFTEKELRAQIGHEMAFWPVAVLRELIDNALDACELGSEPAQIDVTVADDTFTVSDNGPGLPPDTVIRSLDYLVRVSDKAHYISPTRGAMGNALKVVWAAPFVATGSGAVDVVTCGQRHRVSVRLDRIAQQPQIDHQVESATRFVKTGTSVTVNWPGSTSTLTEPAMEVFQPPPTARELVTAYTAFNAHVTFTLNDERFEAVDPQWQKWRPDSPTSAHWYTEDTLRDLIAAYIANQREDERKLTVREFVSQFRGLSSTGKQKSVTDGWSRAYLHEFVQDGDVDGEFVRTLLARMQAQSKAPTASVLGVIGEKHLRAWMAAHGVSGESIRYKRAVGTDNLPYVLEVAFGVNTDDACPRRLFTGLNWSPVIGGEPDATLRQAVQGARLDPHDPVTLVVHIAKPRFAFADRGKTRLVAT